MNIFKATRQQSWYTKKRMQPEREKRWQITELDYDCFASVKKFRLLSVIARVKTVKQGVRKSVIARVRKSASLFPSIVCIFSRGFCSCPY